MSDRCSVARLPQVAEFKDATGSVFDVSCSEHLKCSKCLLGEGQGCFPGWPGTPRNTRPWGRKEAGEGLAGGQAGQGEWEMNRSRAWRNVVTYPVMIDSDSGQLPSQLWGFCWVGSPGLAPRGVTEGLKRHKSLCPASHSPQFSQTLAHLPI